MIEYTGNPYVDVGVAVLELRLQKPCDKFTFADLEAQALGLEIEYKKTAWKSCLRIHFFNCAWTQANPDSEKSKAYINSVLRGYKSKPLYPQRSCFYCNRPAHLLADRSHIPLLAGRTNMSSAAHGEPGLPVCGFCIFAIHFYPLGTIKVQAKREPGRPLFWWACGPDWTRKLTRHFYLIGEKIVALSSDEFANLHWPSTQLLNAAREAIDDWQRIPEAERPLLRDVIGVHATSSGLGPDYDELRIPRGLLEFWREAGSFSAYREIERRSWETQEQKVKAKKKKAKSSAEESVKAEPVSKMAEFTRRNYLYEALGDAFRFDDYREKAKQVAAQFFLKRHGNKAESSTLQVAELFLEKVAGMQKKRLEVIREVADAIAVSREAKWMIDRIMRSGKSLYDFVPVIRSIQRKLSLEGKFISWDRILLALNLEDDGDVTPRDTWLVSELILIRVFELLSQSNMELLKDIESAERPELAPQTTEGVI